jgi:hypothetical protein
MKNGIEPVIEKAKKSPQPDGFTFEFIRPLKN